MIRRHYVGCNRLLLRNGDTIKRMQRDDAKGWGKVGRKHEQRREQSEKAAIRAVPDFAVEGAGGDVRFRIAGGRGDGDLRSGGWRGRRPANRVVGGMAGSETPQTGSRGDGGVGKPRPNGQRGWRGRRPAQTGSRGDGGVGEPRKRARWLSRYCLRSLENGRIIKTKPMTSI